MLVLICLYLFYLFIIIYILYYSSYIPKLFTFKNINLFLNELYSEMDVRIAVLISLLVKR
jgi:hypothetical protein